MCSLLAVEEELEVDSHQCVRRLERLFSPSPGCCCVCGDTPAGGTDGSGDSTGGVWHGCRRPVTSLLCAGSTEPPSSSGFQNGQGLVTSLWGSIDRYSFETLRFSFLTHFFCSLFKNQHLLVSRQMGPNRRGGSGTASFLRLELHSSTRGS